jgi:hypothetical protein
MLLRSKPAAWTDHPLVLPNWDNTPRSAMRGIVFHDATPELFRGVLRKAVEQVDDKPPAQRIVFLKAWNEWAEGNHVEPDQKWGRAWLEVIRDEILSP